MIRGYEELKFEVASEEQDNIEGEDEDEEEQLKKETRKKMKKRKMKSTSGKRNMETCNPKTRMRRTTVITFRVMIYLRLAL